MNKWALRHSARNLPLNDSMPFDKLRMRAVVRRLSRSGEVERDTALEGPEIEISADELSALINPDGRISPIMEPKKWPP
jgi:hypothetical protein